MSGPRIGLALGGGSARGIAHIPMIEAFDELGLKPARIAGTSFGALVGAAYASGLTGKEIREHAVSVLGNRIEAARRLLSDPDMKVWELFDVKSFNQVSIEGSTLANLVLPKKTASEVNKTQIPLTIIATDLTAQEEVVITSGDLREAVAASMALPGLIQAPRLEGRTLVDGAMSNPVPFEHVADGTDLIVAVDVTGGRLSEEDNEAASNLLRAFRSIYVMQHQITKLRREKINPEIYIYPAVDRFRAGEFFKVRDIMAEARPAKDELKRELEKALKAHGG